MSYILALSPTNSRIGRVELYSSLKHPSFFLFAVLNRMCDVGYSLQSNISTASTFVNIFSSQMICEWVSISKKKFGSFWWIFLQYVVVVKVIDDCFRYFQDTHTGIVGLFISIFCLLRWITARSLLTNSNRWHVGFHIHFCATVDLKWAECLFSYTSFRSSFHIQHLTLIWRNLFQNQNVLAFSFFVLNWI